MEVKDSGTLFKVGEPQAAAAAVGAGGGGVVVVQEQAEVGEQRDNEGHQEGRAVQGRRGDVLREVEEAERRGEFDDRGVQVSSGAFDDLSINRITG